MLPSVGTSHSSVLTVVKLRHVCICTCVHEYTTFLLRMTQQAVYMGFMSPIRTIRHALPQPSSLAEAPL